jgi:glycerol dehydrogenase-like iron-containing ADH family enzyme
MSVGIGILIVSKEKEIEMAVSEQYIADLVAELNAQAIADEIERVERKKQFDLDVANGMCAECCEWTYCLCEYYLD